MTDPTMDSFEHDVREQEADSVLARHALLLGAYQQRARRGPAMALEILEDVGREIILAMSRAAARTAEERGRRRLGQG